MKLTISPLSYSDCSTQPDGCLEMAIPVTETITIKNKKRDKFQIKVGGGLTIKNVIIDSLDSLVCKNTILIDQIDDLTDPCLNAEADCCIETNGQVT
jgi:hypothetical protein